MIAWQYVKKMDIKYLGHSSFRLKGKDASLVTDPFDSKMVGLKYPKVKADIVTVSHDHNDHNKVDNVKETKRVVAGPGEYEISGVSIIGIPTYHDDKKGKERGKNTVYLIEMDEVRLAHLGDLGHELSEKVIEQLGDLDVLMVPVGGKFTINYQQAAEVVRNIEPSFILPMHYLLSGMDKDQFGDLKDADPFLKEMGLPVAEEDKINVKPHSVGEEQKIVMLKPA